MAGKRYDLLDSIRGLTILSMVGFHGVWDLIYLFGADWEWYDALPGYIWQQSIYWAFIFLSGFCWSFGRNAFRRGAIVFAGGLAITLVTVLIMPEAHVVFGALTLLGSCMLLMVPLEKLLRRVKPKNGLPVCALLFALTRNINSGWLGFEGLKLVRLPEELYHGLVATYLGFQDPAFFSSDYFSLFPWIFLFLSGYFAFRACKGRGVLQYFRKGTRVLSAIGRNSLPVYLAHQPVLYGVLTLLSRLQEIG
ncbi:MAG: heparan-alpha-glucosaminide N-acetyltransferase domain-containing protein [Butyricicoccaceae bacterium]